MPSLFVYVVRQVLMQTIEREPPSLKSYPDDRQPGGDVFGRNFKEVRYWNLVGERFVKSLFQRGHV